MQAHGHAVAWPAPAVWVPTHFLSSRLARSFKSNSVMLWLSAAHW